MNDEKPFIELNGERFYVGDEVHSLVHGDVVIAFIGEAIVSVSIQGFRVGSYTKTGELWEEVLELRGRQVLFPRKPTITVPPPPKKKAKKWRWVFFLEEGLSYKEHFLITAEHYAEDDFDKPGTAIRFSYTHGGDYGKSLSAYTRTPINGSEIEVDE